MMPMRKIPHLFTLVFLLFFISCASNSGSLLQVPASELETETDQAARPEEVGTTSLSCESEVMLCIGFLIEDGLLEGNSFYQAAFDGVHRAEKDLLANVTLTNIDPQNGNLAESINNFAEQKFDIIVTAGPNMLLNTLEAAKKYPDINFVGVDQNQFLAYENILGISFDEEKAAFLAGHLAALISKSGIVGVVLGETPPTVYRYLEGFEAGVYAADPNIEVLHSFYSGQAENVYNDPSWGQEMTREMLAQGADVIFATGGDTALGALQETVNNSDALCIGADLDQYIESPETRPCLVSSVVRNIEDEVFEAIAWSALGKFPSGNIVGGYQFSPFYDFDLYFTADIKAYIKNLERDLANNVIPIDGTYVAQNVPTITIQQE